LQNLIYEKVEFYIYIFAPVSVPSLIKLPKLSEVDGSRSCFQRLVVYTRIRASWVGSRNSV